MEIVLENKNGLSAVEFYRCSKKKVQYKGDKLLAIIYEVDNNVGVVVNTSKNCIRIEGRKES